MLSEMLEHHLDGQDRAERVGHILAGVLRCRAVNRLEH